MKAIKVLAEAIASLWPLVKDEEFGGWERVSKEKLVHLGQIAAGVMIALGLDSTEIEPMVLGEWIVGAWIILHGLAAIFRRHRESEVK